MVSEGEQCEVSYDFSCQDPAAHGEPLYLDVCTELKGFEGVLAILSSQGSGKNTK